MAGRPTLIERMATEAGLPVPTAVKRLAANGIPVSEQSGSIPRKKIDAARRVLRLRRRTSRARTPRLLAPPPDASASQDGASTHVAESPRAALKRERREAKWRVVGKPEPIAPLTPEDVNRIHWALVNDFKDSKDPVSPAGIRDVTLFESAVFRPQTAMGDLLKYPTVSMATAALFHALVQNHPFHNGNKRTALVALLVMLDRHGYVMQATQDELYDYVLTVAQHDLELDDRSGSTRDDQEMQTIARWVQAHIRKVERRERRIKWRALKAILHSFGCSCDVLPGNRIRITRDELSSHVNYTDEGREVELNTVHKIRHDLELDDDHGYDSAIFYNRADRIPEFINKYRRTLERLAKV